MKLKLMLFLVAMIGASVGARVLLDEPAKEAQASETQTSKPAPTTAKPKAVEEAPEPGLSKLAKPTAQEGEAPKTKGLRAMILKQAKYTRPVKDAAKDLTRVNDGPKRRPESAKEAAKRVKEVEGDAPKEDKPAAPTPWPSDTKGIVKRILPYMTEGGIAGLLGVALGVTTKSFARLILGGVALCFIVIQFLAYKDIIVVDWGRFVLWAQSFVFNLSDKEMGFGAILQHKIPAAGALGVGYLLGLKKG